MPRAHRSVHRSTRRAQSKDWRIRVILGAAVTTLVSGCSHAFVPRQSDGAFLAPYRITLSFDVPSTIIAVDKPPRDRARRSMDRVLSVGGRVIESRGDSLLLAPTFIVRESDAPSEKAQLISTRERGLPDVVLIELTAGVHPGDFGWRTQTMASDVAERVIRLGIAAVFVVGLGGIFFGAHR